MINASWSCHVYVTTRTADAAQGPCIRSTGGPMLLFEICIRAKGHRDTLMCSIMITLKHWLHVGTSNDVDAIVSLLDSWAPIF